MVVYYLKYMWVLEVFDVMGELFSEEIVVEWVWVVVDFNLNLIIVFVFLEVYEVMKVLFDCFDCG